MCRKYGAQWQEFSNSDEEEQQRIKYNGPLQVKIGPITRLRSKLKQRVYQEEEDVGFDEKQMEQLNILERAGRHLENESPKQRMKAKQSLELDDDEMKRLDSILDDEKE
jgi:hypothetical protein